MVDATAGEIRVTGVSKTFLDAHGSEVHALHDVDLTVRPGEFISLLGPSGCGKSTLLRLVAGLDTPSAGELTLDSEPISGPHHLRGLVFQDPTLFPWLTVRDNVAVGLKARKVYAEHAGDVDEYLELVGLTGFEKAYPHQLSGGMAQRAALARALVNHPKVLLLDEPLGALDAFTRMNMQDEILRIWTERKTTMVFVTHDIDEAIYLSDRIVVMTPRPGRIASIHDVHLGRPRDRALPEFLELRAKILELLHFAHSAEPLPYYL